MILCVVNPDDGYVVFKKTITKNSVEDIYNNDETKSDVKKVQCSMNLDIFQAGALVQLLNQNSFFRQSFLQSKQACQYKIILKEPETFHIDKKFCRLVSFALWEAIEREDAIHWLSTLGGAFSNLGEHSQAFAKKAGDNALRQMKIIVKSGDPSALYHCWIYIAMSLMQQKRLKSSRKVIQWIFDCQKGPDGDPRIRKMAQGCWARLKFHWDNNKKKKVEK